MNVRKLLRLFILDTILAMASLTVFNCLFGYSTAQLIGTSIVLGGCGAGLDYFKGRKSKPEELRFSETRERMKGNSTLPKTWLGVGKFTAALAIGSFLVFTPISLLVALVLNLDPRHALAISLTWSTFVGVLTAILSGVRVVRKAP